METMRGVVVREGVVLTRGLGRRLMTISSSRSMPLLASERSLATSLFSRSSFIFAILSSRVRRLRGRGMATASNTSSLSPLLLTSSSPFNALSASEAVPPMTSSTAVGPLTELAGERSVLMDDRRFSLRSMPDASAARPSSQDCMSALRSTPMESYCSKRFDPSSEMSSDSSRDRSDSSLRSWSFACKPRMPVENPLSLRS